MTARRQAQLYGNIEQALERLASSAQLAQLAQMGAQLKALKFQAVLHSLYVSYMGPQYYRMLFFP